jgi:hypothetical protein
VDLPDFWSFNRSRDEHLISSEEITWEGPFRWPGTSGEEGPRGAGVYLLTFAYQDGYILRSAGVTNDMVRRMKEHRRNYYNGKYTLLNVEAAQAGIRQERWHGWGRMSEEVRKAHQNEIRTWAKEQVEAYRLFFHPEQDLRMRERLEFAILHAAWRDRKPWSDLMDGGMHTRGRFNHEVPRVVRSRCACPVYGLPLVMEG